jgi:hypothetical protein
LDSNRRRNGLAHYIFYDKDKKISKVDQAILIISIKTNGLKMAFKTNNIVVSYKISSIGCFMLTLGDAFY